MIFPAPPYTGENGFSALVAFPFRDFPERGRQELEAILGALALWNVKACALTAGDRERAKQGTLGPPKASEFRQVLQAPKNPARRLAPRADTQGKTLRDCIGRRSFFAYDPEVGYVVAPESSIG